jgi:hypothetical protein
MKPLLLIIIFFAGIGGCFAQTKDSLNLQLCALTAKNINPDTYRQDLDKIMAQGAEINCHCEITQTHRDFLKVVGNNIKGFFAAFINRTIDRSNEYYTTKTYYSPVHLWTLGGQMPMVEYAALRYGANLNQPSSKNTYPLEELVGIGKLQAAQNMVAWGAKPNLITLCTPTSEMADWLIGQGTPLEKIDWNCILKHEKVFLHLVNQYPIDFKNENAGKFQGVSPKILEAALQRGLKIDKEFVMHHFTFGQSYSLIEYIKVFVKHGVNFGECGFFGCPLEKIVEKNDLEAVKLVVENGGLHTEKAICVKDMAILEYLLQKGFPKDKIHLKCILDDITKFKTTVQKCEIDLKTYPISKNLEGASLEVLDYVLAAGVPPDKELLVYFFTFRSEAMYQYAALYAKYKLSLEDCGFYGCPLQLAIDNNNLQTVRFLVENGVSIEKPFKDGSLPLEYAQSKKKTLIVRYLEEKMKK